MEKKKQSTIYIRTSPDIKEQFEKLKDKERVSGSSLIELLLNDYVSSGERFKKIEKKLESIEEKLDKNNKRKLRDEQILK